MFPKYPIAPTAPRPPTTSSDPRKPQEKTIPPCRIFCEQLRTQRLDLGFQLRVVSLQAIKRFHGLVLCFVLVGSNIEVVKLFQVDNKFSIHI